MSRDARPQLSVVVPIYNAGEYLVPCLESLLASRLADLEIICVDDGSTDGSGLIADRFAERDRRLRVLHTPNHGIGRARNTGVGQASGRYLAFADADDRVPPRAYEQLCGTLERTGSDLSTGLVRRFTDTRSWRSPLHALAITGAARRTHISRMPSLVYDTTVWNKVFRRSFWDAHALRFREGVMYEDMAVAIAAHVLAGSVDLITPIVYEWRGRSDGVLSQSQRSAERKNMDDRMTTVRAVGDFLDEHHLPAAREELDRKILNVDLPLYLPVWAHADQAFREIFSQHVKRYVERVDPRTVEQLAPWPRVAFELLRLARFDDAAQLAQDRRAVRDDFQVRRKGRRLYAQLPHLGDPAVGVPDAAFDVTAKLPVRTSVEELLVDGNVLVLKGYAFIDKVPLTGPWSALRYIELRGPGSARMRRRVRPRRRPTGSDWGGFEVRIPLARLPVPVTGSISYTVQMKIVTATARRGVPLGHGDPDPTPHNVLRVRADGTRVVIHTTPQGLLRVEAQRLTLDPTPGAV